MHVFDQLVVHWNERNIPQFPTATSADVQSFEAANGLRLPDEVRLYLGSVGGTQEFDANLFSFWPLTRWRVSQGVSSGVRIAFADYSLSAIRYSISLAGEVMRVESIMASDEVVVSTNLSEFAHRYLNDPLGLILAG